MVAHPRIGALDEREEFEVILGNMQSFVGSDDEAGTHLDGGFAQAGCEAHELVLSAFAEVDAGRATLQQPETALTSVFVGSNVDAAAMALKEATDNVPQQ